jgi:NAD(P)-dependent dehydrogenase (short-subunit alcohol dehydrogenase family)
MDLTNASAIVTGGAGGFGSATVRSLNEARSRRRVLDVDAELAQVDDRGSAPPDGVGGERAT